MVFFRPLFRVSLPSQTTWGSCLKVLPQTSLTLEKEAGASLQSSSSLYHSDVGCFSHYNTLPVPRPWEGFPSLSLSDCNASTNHPSF